MNPKFGSHEPYAISPYVKLYGLRTGVGLDFLFLGLGFPHTPLKTKKGACFVFPGCRGPKP